MPDLFKGLNKMSDEDIRLQISLFQSVNVGNAVKETSYRAVGKLIGLANMFAIKQDGTAGVFEFQEKGIEDVIVENVKKLKGMTRDELNVMLRDILIEKCNLLSMGSADDTSSDEKISILIIRETAKVYSLNEFMPPSLLAENISKKYYEQFMLRLHKELSKENEEEARITDNNLQQAMNAVSIEAKRDMSRKIIINEFSGRGLGRLIRTETGTKNLTAVVECVGLEPFNILRTLVMSVYDAVLGINRISRAILAQLVWVSVKANDEKITVNTDMLPGFIQADQRLVRDEEEKVLLLELSNRKELDKKISAGNLEIDKLNLKLNELLKKLKDENDDYNERKLIFQQLEGVREQYNDASTKTKDEIKKYYADVVSSKKKYDNAETDLKKRVIQVKELKTKITQKETELADNQKEYSVADQNVRVLTKRKWEKIEALWGKFFLGLTFEHQMFEELVIEFTDAEILKIEEYLKEMNDSTDVAAFAVKTEEDTVSEGTTISYAICMVANSKNAEIEYVGRHIRKIKKH